jgi:hypothetical protein
MINFQKDYDITTVGVELRKFKPLEQRHYCVFRTCIALVVALNFVAITVDELWQRRSIKNGEKEE